MVLITVVTLLLEVHPSYTVKTQHKVELTSHQWRLCNSTPRETLEAGWSLLLQTPDRNFLVLYMLARDVKALSPMKLIVFIGLPKIPTN